MIFAVFDPSPLTVCINCSFTFILFNVIVHYLPADVWNYTLEYIRNVSWKFVDQQLYVTFGPVFDYNADGLADDDLTAARYTLQR